MQTLRIDRDGELTGLVTITLNRPESLNAISFTMHRELQQACAELADDPAIRVVIVTGEGRAFSAGADLGKRGAQAASVPDEAHRLPPLAERLRSATGGRTCAALEGLPQVTIGAVNGLAVGGAVAFLACLDIRIAAESAWFSIPEVDLDIPLTWHTLPRLVRELGPARTKELVMACDRFSSSEALSWGFVNRVVPDGEALSAARSVAQRLLAKDPMAVAMTKSSVNAIAEAMVPAALSHADPDYLFMARLLRSEAKRNDVE
ncbi:MAG: enoyl-CoA hydratase/isomerase family protein [Dehalococcoidia bacterium]|nr:enoyl-CoA hydratase/isomerase family protein [Dehalococcoidia bacterium]